MPAQAMPIAKIGGSCPPGYSQQGNMCVPRSGAKATHVKVGGACAPGYAQHGEYCVAQSANAKIVYPRAGAGSCPQGYVTHSEYCVEQ